MKIKPDLRVELGGIELKNPVMTASGTFGYASEFKEFVDLNRLGGIIVKGLSLTPTPGNPPPRIVETAGGMLNAIGLENVGFEAFVEKKLPFFDEIDPPVFVNIYGKSVDEYIELASRLDTFPGVSGLEVNISCPNVEHGGMAFGVDPDTAGRLVEGVRKSTGKHVMVKLSPNVTDVTPIAKSVENAGADSISLINTLTGMAIDIETRRPKLANITGGLSGPAIKPVTVRMVWQVANCVRIPVVGVGGIMNEKDALEFFIAGASAVQIGTANFVNPGASINVLDGIEVFLAERNISKLTDIIGSFTTEGL